MRDTFVKNSFEILAAFLAIFGVGWIQFAYRGLNGFEAKKVENAVDYFLILQGIAMGTFGCVTTGLICQQASSSETLNVVLVTVQITGFLLILFVLNKGAVGFFLLRKQFQYLIRAVPLALLIFKIGLEFTSHVSTVDNTKRLSVKTDDTNLTAH